MSVVLESKTRIDALIAAVNSKTGGSATDLTVAVQALCDGAGESGGYELLYETTFTLDASITDSTQTTIATITTGLETADNKPSIGDNLLLVVICTNDTDPDTSYNHFIARTQAVPIYAGGYSAAQSGSGIVYSTNYAQYGSSYGVFASTVAQWAKSITLATKGHASFGFAPSGDYSVKIYKLDNDLLGLGGVV